MKNIVELAAEFILRTAFVDANALLKDECSVEYQEPSQAQNYALLKDPKAVNEPLKHIADMLGRMTHTESTSRPTVVGEEVVVGAIRHVWRIALKTYTTTLNERVSKDYMTFDAGGGCE